VHLPATSSALPDGTLIEASIDADKLPPGVWRIWMRPGEDQPEIRLQARLLVSRKQPIALLPGPAPRTGAAPAIPQPRRRQQPAAASRSRLRAAAVKGVDAVLSRLPDERAARYRARLAQVAHRVTG
jgi:hypothetical protein